MFCLDLDDTEFRTSMKLLMS